MRTSIILFLVLMFSSCAKNDARKTAEAIDVALSSLSDGDCESAIKVLDEAGYQAKDAVYLQVLASAYACRAGFNLISFITNDLSTIISTSPATILRSVSKMSLSSETSADSDNYVAIRTGLSHVLQSSNQVSRASQFGTRKAADMGFQAIVLSIVNLGKFLNYYGNVNAAGVKGGGTQSNKCFLTYTDPRAQAQTGVSTGACVSDNDGHPDLDQTTVEGRRRMCEGVMLLTNLIDTLGNVELPNSSDLSNLTAIASQMNTIKTAAVGAGLSTLIDMTSQSTCEDYVKTPSQLLDMEFFYALLFESGLQ